MAFLLENFSYLKDKKNSYPLKKRVITGLGNKKVHFDTLNTIDSECLRDHFMH